MFQKRLNNNYFATGWLQQKSTIFTKKIRKKLQQKYICVAMKIWLRNNKLTTYLITTKSTSI
jgi:hypothetical protein